MTGRHFSSTSSELAEGARNILIDCAGVRKGDKVLLVGEEGTGAFFGSSVCLPVADLARDLGAKPTVIMARDPGVPGEFPRHVLEAMEQTDHTIFFTRFGDRIRFADTGTRSAKTMCYVHNEGYLGGIYGRMPFKLFEEVSDALLRRIAVAKSCTITCPLGTNLETRSEPPSVAADFTVKQFPVMITPPLSCTGMTGRLALSHFLISTSTSAYDGSLLTFDDVVFALADNGRIIGFEGPAASREKVQQHFERVAAMIGGDPYALNSWHTGIYPPTYFDGRAIDDIERWGDIAFGSPRYTHLHACGTNPGDVCISLFDATITFDGEAFWQAGHFAFLDSAETRDILKRYPDVTPDQLVSGDIGI